MAGALHFVRAMWKPMVVLVVAAGCQFDPEQPATLAELGPVTLDFYIGERLMWLHVEYDQLADAPCPVLGDDFAARIGDVPLSTYPGGVMDTCTQANTSGPCVPAGQQCYTPYMSLVDPPLDANPVLVLGDASRTIECKLGDAFVPRSVTRVPDGSWDVSPGETMTVQWLPGGDLAHYKFEVSFVEWKRNILPVSYQTDRNRITFRVPSGLHPGYQTLLIGVTGEVPTMLKGCTVPDHRLYGYSVEQYVHVL